MNPRPPGWPTGSWLDSTTGSPGDLGWFFGALLRGGVLPVGQLEEMLSGVPIADEEDGPRAGVRGRAVGSAESGEEIVLGYGRAGGVLDT
ncbi:hypothetical protein AB0O76_43765, partial [Streptomyces sp. NPDC086554]